MKTALIILVAIVFGIVALALVIAYITFLKERNKLKKQNQAILDEIIQNLDLNCSEAERKRIYSQGIKADNKDDKFAIQFVKNSIFGYRYAINADKVMNAKERRLSVAEQQTIDECRKEAAKYGYLTIETLDELVKLTEASFAKTNSILVKSQEQQLHLDHLRVTKEKLISCIQEMREAVSEVY